MTLAIANTFNNPHLWIAKGIELGQLLVSLNFNVHKDTDVRGKKTYRFWIPDSEPY